MNRSIDELGRIVIPAEFRRKLNISRDTLLKLDIVNNQIIIEKDFDNAVDTLQKIKDCLKSTKNINDIKKIMDEYQEMEVK